MPVAKSIVINCLLFMASSKLYDYDTLLCTNPFNPKSAIYTELGVFIQAGFYFEGYFTNL